MSSLVIVGGAFLLGIARCVFDRLFHPEDW